MDVCLMVEAQQGADYDQLLRLALAAEGHGFHGFFRSDHYLAQGAGDGWPGPTNSWVTLAGLARDTTRIRLGTLMTAATFQLPGPLAIAIANVDQMSGGRAELGLGAGWHEPEHLAYGIPFPSLRERFDRFEEQLEIITGLWDTPGGSTFDYEGRYHRLVASPALPKPLARPRIIVGGAGRRRTPRLAATFADEFNVTFRSVAETREMCERVEEACARAGRERPMSFSVAQEICCGRSGAEVASRASDTGRSDEHLRANAIVGSPASVVESLGRFVDIGIARVYVRMMNIDDVGLIDLLGRDVLPQLPATGTERDEVEAG
jgi:F420-dependent oxidoreductase-like protein